MKKVEPHMALGAIASRMAEPWSKSIWVLFFVFMSCNKETHDLSRRLSDGEIKVAVSKAFLDTGRQGVKRYTAKNVLGGGERLERRPIFFQFLQLMKEYQAPTEWGLIHQEMAPQIERYSSDPSLQKEYTLDIQYIALNMMDKYLLRVAPDRKVLSTLDYYMNLLYVHQGVDLDVMANAVRRLSQGGPIGSRTSLYRDFVLNQSEQAIAETKELLEQEKARYPQAGNSGDAHWSMVHIQVFEEQIREAEYAMALLGQKN